MSVVVSVDFDYFIRESPLWNWSHLDDMVWHVRYAELDLFAETNIGKFADFPPDALGRILRKKGLQLDRRTKLARAFEHEKAYDFLKGKPIKLLVNFDAHHDIHDHDTYVNRPAKKVEVGNWLWFLKPRGMIYIVYPKWCIRERAVPRLGRPKENVRILTIRKLPHFNQHVDYLFVCRSDAWTPPHHDETFEQMFSILLRECNKKRFKDYGAYRPRNWQYDAKYPLKLWNEDFARLQKNRPSGFLTEKL